MSDPELMTDDERADAGIATDYTLENLCPECGDPLDGHGGFADDLDAAEYGRPGRTCAVHDECMQPHHHDQIRARIDRALAELDD